MLKLQRPPVRKTETRKLNANAPLRQWKDKLDVWVDSFLQKLAQKSASVRKALRRVKPQHALSAAVLAGSALLSGVSQAGELITGPIKVSDTLNSGPEPRLAADSNGNFVVVWAAYDIPATKQVVYAQRFDAAMAPQGGAIVIPPVGAASTPRLPNVKVDPDGDFVVVWQENGASNYDIFAQRFNPAGAPQGSPLPVATDAYNSFPAVGINAAGDFVVGWHTYTAPANQFLVRQFSAAGVPSAPITVPADSVIGNKNLGPQIAMDASGNFVAVWANYNDEVKFARFDSGGIPQGDVRTIDAGGLDAGGPVVAMDPRGDFVIAFRTYDAVNYIYGVQARLFSPAGIENPNSLQFYGYSNQLEVAISSVGDIVVAASDYSGTFAHRATAAGVATTSFFLSDSTNSSIFLDRFSNLTAAYSDYYDGTDYVVRYGSGFVQNVVTANGYTPESQSNPAVAMDANGNFVVVWQGYSTADTYGTGISARLFNSYGIPLGSDIQINTTFEGDQIRPAVAMDANGNFAVIWKDYSTYSLKARAFNPAGSATSSEIVIQENFYYDTSCVVMDANGSFWVGWSGYYYFDKFEYGYLSYRQNFTLAGAPGTVETIFDSADIDLAIDPTGNMVVVNKTYYDGYVNVSRFNSLGVQQGETATIGSGDNPQIAIDSAGNFIVTFESSGEYSPVTVMRFNAAGAQQGNSVQIDDVIRGSSDVAMDSRGNFTVVWSAYNDDTGYDETFAQRFNVSGEPSGTPLIFSDASNPAAALDPLGDLVVVWDEYVYNSYFDAKFQLFRVAVPDAITVFQGSAPVAVPVVENDGNAAVIDSTLLITEVVQGAHGTVVITGDGTGLTYQPAPGFTGVDTFTYKVESAALGAQSTTVGVTVVPANDRPALVNDAKIVNPGVETPIDVLANDTNPSQFTVPLKVTAVTQGANGVVTINANGSAIGYTPNIGFAGSDSFLYTVTTENGGTATARVNITVNTPPQIQSGPTANPTPATVLEVVQFLVAGVDAEGSVTYTWDFGDGSTDDGANVSHSFTPAGTYSINVTVRDAGGLTATATIQLVVNPIGFGGPPGGVDSDGDGFSDELEQGAGSSPTNVNDRPNGATKTNDQIQTPKLAIKSNFGKVDTATLGGAVQLPSGFQANGAQVVANIGGVIKTFTLDAKGKSPKADSAFVIAIKSNKDGTTPAQKAKFSLKINKFEFSDKLNDEGFTSEAAKKVPKTVKCELILRGHYYSAIVNVTYTSNGKTGAAK